MASLKVLEGGGFTPVGWESRESDKADAGLKSFLFTLQNPHNAHTLSLTDDFGTNYTNDIGLDGKTFFAGSQCFKVRELEVLEIAD